MLGIRKNLATIEYCHKKHITTKNNEGKGKRGIGDQRFRVNTIAVLPVKRKCRGERLDDHETMTLPQRRNTTEKYGYK
jgi:hypothetical protein